MKNTLFSAILVGLATSAQASSISWGGAQFSTNYAANATPLQDGAADSITFELGIFVKVDGSAFDPNLGNVEEWADRFVPFGTAGTSNYDESEFGATGLKANYFGGWVDLGDGPGKVPTSMVVAGGNLIEGRKVYIWGYTTKNLSGAAEPEWFLATGESGGNDPTNTNWLVPNDDGGNGDFTYTWDINNATTALVGSIDDNVGEGELTTPSTPLGFSDIQFATIPESSTVLLACLGSLGLLRRRRS